MPKAPEPRIGMPAEFNTLLDKVVFGSITEILEELEALDAEAMEANAAFRKVLRDVYR